MFKVQCKLQLSIIFYGNFFSFAGNTSYGGGHFKQKFLAVGGEKGY